MINIVLFEINKILLLKQKYWNNYENTGLNKPKQLINNKILYSITF